MKPAKSDNVFHEPFRCVCDLCDCRMIFALGNDYLISSATIFERNLHCPFEKQSIDYGGYFNVRCKVDPTCPKSGLEYILALAGEFAKQGI